MLEYSWLTMLCLFQVYSKVSQLYIYIYLFLFRFFSHVGYRIEWISRCYTVGPCDPSLLYVIVCIYEFSSNAFPAFLLGQHYFSVRLFYVSWLLFSLLCWVFFLQNRDNLQNFVQQLLFWSTQSDLMYTNCCN